MVPPNGAGPAPAIADSGARVDLGSGKGPLPSCTLQKLQAPRAEHAGEGGVTGKRKFSRKISPSRNGRSQKGEVWRQARAGGSLAAITNGKYFPDELWDTRNDPDSCRACGEGFAPGRTRYLVLTETRHGNGWGVASVCMDCFKCLGDDSVTKLERETCECAGCGEPILTVKYPRKGHWNVCSNRCDQRVYRKRRHGRSSVVDWKREYHLPRCKCCRKEFTRRRDAQFCCSACRQWAYRRRKFGASRRRVSSPPGGKAAP